jgi:hypothetical protein
VWTLDSALFRLVLRLDHSVNERPVTPYSELYGQTPPYQAAIPVQSGRSLQLYRP